MSIKTGVVKMAIKCTPNKMVIWVANIILKGIAELTDFSFDLDTRKAYVQTKLYGEEEAIEILLDGFVILNEEGSYKLLIQQAKSNRPWMNNILAKIVGKAWKIPVMPQYKAHLDLLADVFKAEKPAQDVIN